MSRPRVALIGGHGALAPVLAELLEDRAELSRLTTLERVDADTEPLSLDRVIGAPLVVLAMTDEAAIAAAARAREAGSVVVDLTGRLEGATPVWTHRALPDRVARGAALRVVPGLAGPVGAVIGALGPLSPRLAVVTTLESAAVFDRPGMDALTDQVRALLAFGEPETGVLGDRLAFNVIPSMGEDDAAAERELVGHIRAAAGAGAPLVRASRHLIPTYSGEGAALDLAVEGSPSVDAVVEHLGALRDVRVGRADAATPHEATDVDSALVGRLRVGPGRVALWLAADRLRSTVGVPILRLFERCT